jgi:cell division protease FtsH
MKKILQNIFLVIFFLVLISSLFALFNPEIFEEQKEVPFSQIAEEINQGKIKTINVSGEQLFIEYQDQGEAFAIKESGTSLIESLNSYGVNQEKLKNVQIKVLPQTGGIWEWLMPLLIFLPFVFLIWFFWNMSKQVRSGTNQTFSFLKTPAKLFGGSKKKKGQVTFKDIAGIEEAKQEIREVVDFLKNPKKFLRMGAQIPRGVLLIGPPGTGKTLLARAVANESNVPFYSVVGSEFIELFVGVGASRTRNLFIEAKKNQPCLIFIDELDAIGKKRMPGFGGGHEEREQTLNQILAEMDGFERDTGIIIIGATNKPESLDSALLRPGRFDRRIILDLPDLKGRKEILKIHSRTKPLAGDVHLDEVAERTPGFSGADLANLANEAAILAALRNKKQVSQEEFLESIEKVLLGPERRSHLLSKKEKKISAYHESGHALTSALIPEAEEVRKISIISRGMAGGYTLALPKEEKRMKTKSEFLAEISVLLGGFCAERIKFKEISTGASQDLEKATALARNLVTKYGMSKLGPVTFGIRESSPFLGLEIEAEKNYSEKTAALIDKETVSFIKEAEKRTMNLLKNKKKLLEKIAQRLMEKEMIEKEEFEKIIKDSK